MKIEEAAQLDHEIDHRHGRLARLRHALVPHSHDAAESIQDADEASSAGIRTAWISMVAMAVTALLQVAIVMISGSLGLLADTIHNVGHLVTTVPLLIAFWLGRRPPTASFPFGFRRLEDLVGVLIAMVIAASAAWIVWESVRGLVDPRPLTHLGWVFATGIVGAAGNEIAAVYRIRTGRRIGSAALVAEVHHARADGLTSVAVVVGVLGVWLGFPRADAVVGLVIAATILAILVQSVRSIARRLLDGVEPGTIAAIGTAACEVPGVEGTSDVKARWTGHRLEAQLVVEMERELDLASADRIADGVVAHVMESVPHVGNVTVRPRPTLAQRPGPADVIPSVGQSPQNV
ncbi:cation transporter [Aeromicrobium phragmitis]|uniref:Cation transporter n=1 Tax=Aeromicrobium phragmitis TaxID=2478914 RepID=A0A3L8PS50_9ACTN|nr:cation diffusion facilitator family transporter [Aeromicrobium phragmitis]RLV57218.1 cation transporter [Aeromicrobium phragmitis]